MFLSIICEVLWVFTRNVTKDKKSKENLQPHQRKLKSLSVFGQMFILLGLVNNAIVRYNPMQFEAERQSKMLSFHCNCRDHITCHGYFVCLCGFFLFKVSCFPILLVKAIFVLFPSTESNYTFDFGPSELGVCLIDEASWCLINMPMYVL